MPDECRELPIINRGQILGLRGGARLESFEHELVTVRGCIKNASKVAAGDTLDLGQLLVDAGSIVECGRRAVADCNLNAVSKRILLKTGLR